MEEKRFLSPSDAIKLLGISYPSLLRLVKSEKIPFVRIGKSLRFPKSYFDNLEAEALNRGSNGEEYHEQE